jgi:hypothetical protein
LLYTNVVLMLATAGLVLIYICGGIVKNKLWAMFLVTTCVAVIFVFSQSAKADTTFSGPGIPAGPVQGSEFYGCYAVAPINGSNRIEGIRKDPAVHTNNNGINPQFSDIIVATGQTIANAAGLFCDANKWTSILAKLQVQIDKESKGCVTVSKRWFVRNGGNGHDFNQPPSVKLCPKPIETHPCELKFKGQVVKIIQVPDLATCKQQVIQ